MRVGNSKSLIKFNALLFFMNLENQEESFYIFFELHLLHILHYFFFLEQKSFFPFKNFYNNTKKKHLKGTIRITNA